MQRKDNIRDHLNVFRHRYYKNEILKGTLITLLVILINYLLVSTLDYTFKFGSVLRGILFFSFSSVALFLLITRIIDPLFKLLHIRQGITVEEAARKVGSFFPMIRVKLLNLIQLDKNSVAGNSGMSLLKKP